MAWTGSCYLDPQVPLAESTAPFDIEVVSLDWRWLLVYPQEGVASLNRLVVPAGVPLRLRGLPTNADILFNRPASNLLMVASFPILTATYAMLLFDRYCDLRFFTNDRFILGLPDGEWIARLCCDKIVSVHAHTVCARFKLRLVEKRKPVPGWKDRPCRFQTTVGLVAAVADPGNKIDGSAVLLSDKTNHDSLEERVR